ncbi:MAG: hypothetical protein WCQ95_06925 [Bacteroidota bacterium]
MECQKIRNKLVDYIYKDLEKSSAEHVAKHLVICEDCLDVYSKISNVLLSANLNQEVYTDDFYSTRLMAKIENRKTTSSGMVFLNKIYQPALLAAMVVVGILIGVKISDKFPATNATATVNTKDMVLSQLANEYYVSNTRDEILENYYLTDKK